MFLFVCICVCVCVFLGLRLRGILSKINFPHHRQSQPMAATSPTVGGEADSAGRRRPRAGSGLIKRRLEARSLETPDSSFDLCPKSSRNENSEYCLFTQL